MYRRIQIVAFAALIPVVAAACGDKPKPVTTTVSGASAPTTDVAHGPVSRTTEAQPVVVTYEDGESAYRSGNYADASRLFLSYGERHPKNVTAQYMAGLAAWKAGDLKGADAAFDRALAIDSAHVKTLLNSSRVLLQLGRTDEALDRINTVLGIDSTSGVARRLQGLALEKKGDVEGAIDAYQQALLADERDVWAMNNLGVLYIQQGRAEEALAPLARAVEIQANSPVFQNNLGTALEQTGHFAEATEAYSAAVTADSTYHKAIVSLARVQDRADSTSAAPISLPELAQSFQLQIRMLRDSARIVEPDSAGTPVDTTVHADSTTQR